LVLIDFEKNEEYIKRVLLYFLNKNKKNDILLNQFSIVVDEFHDFIQKN